MFYYVCFLVLDSHLAVSDDSGFRTRGRSEMSSSFFGHFQTYLPTFSTMSQLFGKLPTYPYLNLNFLNVAFLENDWLNITIVIKYIETTLI